MTSESGSTPYPPDPPLPHSTDSNTMDTTGTASPQQQQLHEHSHESHHTESVPLYTEDNPNNHADGPPPRYQAGGDEAHTTAPGAEGRERRGPHDGNDGNSQGNNNHQSNGDNVAPRQTHYTPPTTDSDMDAPPPYPGPQPPTYTADYPAPPYPGPPETGGGIGVGGNYPYHNPPMMTGDVTQQQQQEAYEKALYHQMYQSTVQGSNPHGAYAGCPGSRYPHQSPRSGDITITAQPHGEEQYVSGFGGIMGNRDRDRPNNWLALSVVTCLCFSPLFGLFAICFSVMAHTAYNTGDLEASRRNAMVALSLSFLGITLSIVMAIVIFSAY